MITMRLIHRAGKVKNSQHISWRSGPQDVRIITSDAEAAAASTAAGTQAAAAAASL